MPAAKIPGIGDTAPAFRLPALPDGKPVSLADFRGRYVVLYFYPRDMTPGCTTEACDFRDLHTGFQRAEAAVLGISTDDVGSHQKFAAKYELPFPLLADEDHAVAAKYGVWVEKNMYGKKSWGVQRATFLIDPDGKIAAAWPKVKVAGHAADVASRLAELSR
jgi:peroxiredoxin Q/BCP